MKKKKDNSFQGTLFPEFEEMAATSKPAKKSAKQEIEELKAELEAQKAENQSLKEENLKLISKAKAYDDLISCKFLFPMSTIAKAFGRTAIWMNTYLNKKRVQFKNGEIWTLYRKYDSCGYTGVGWYEYGKDDKGRALIRPHTYWTTKGMSFIRELLIVDGYWSE